MRAAIAYFAGAGTVIAAIGLGLGGGLTIANVMSPHHEKIEQTRLDQRMSAKSIPQTAQADQPKGQAGEPKPPVAAATNAAATANPPPASGPQKKQAAAPPAPAPQPSPQPARAKLAKEQPAKPVEPQTAKSNAAPHEQAAASSDDTNAKPRSPEDANAKADDSDLKRLAAEKRKADRHRKWAERKKAQQQRDARLRDGDGDANGRRDTGRPVIRGNDGPRIVLQDDDDFDRPRNVDRRGPSGRPFGFPGFNLFGADND